MKKLTQNDLATLALGCSILGSGGGGDPRYDLMMTERMMEKFGDVELVSLSEVPDEALVAPVGFMGAPLVTLERYPSGKEFEALIRSIAEVAGEPPAFLMPAEIGGANAFTPLMMGAMLGLPVVDADTLGRAFPELQMSSCHLRGISPTPAFLADPFGRVEVIYPKDSLELEAEGRRITVEMGSNALFSIYLMRGKQLRTGAIAGSYTHALHLGSALQQGIEPFLKSAEVLARGKIVDIDHRVEGGFLRGSLLIDEGNSAARVHYQNEYLLAKRGDLLLGATPDILLLIEEESAIPISSESLLFGLRVLLVRLPSPAIWKTPEGLKLVGPSNFGDLS